MTANRERPIQASESKCCRRMLVISYREHKARRIYVTTGRYPRRTSGLLLSTVKHHKLSWFGDVCRHDTLPKIIPQGTVDNSHRTDFVNHGRTTAGNREASRCGHCCASRMTEVDGQSPQRMRVLDYHNNAWASRILVSQLVSQYCFHSLSYFSVF